MTNRTNNRSLDELWVLGVNIAVLPAEERQGAQLCDTRTSQLLADLAEIFPGTEAAVVADDERTEFFLCSDFDASLVTDFLCREYFDHVSPQVPTTHPLGLRYQLNGHQAAQRLMQSSVGLYDPGAAGIPLTEVDVTMLLAPAPEQSLIAPLFDATERAAERAYEARLSLLGGEEVMVDLANETMLRTLTVTVEDIVEEELLRLTKDLDSEPERESHGTDESIWPEALQLNFRPHLNRNVVLSPEQVIEVAIWSARGLLNDCANHLHRRRTESPR